MEDFGKKPFLERHKWLPLAAICVYLGLLALGTAGELFHVKWILDLPIFKGP